MMLDEAPNNRRISRLPEPLLAKSTPYTSGDFLPEVRTACTSDRFITSQLKISKVLLLGNVAVGKSSLVNRFCHNTFDSNYKATIGVDFEVERFDILRVPFNLQIWDTAGQERFKCIASSYYRGAHAVIVVFDVTDLYSLSSVPKWLEDALKANVTRPLVFLVGAKRDLLSEASYTNVEYQATRMARALQAEYWTVSSKTGLNIDKFFLRVAALTFNTALFNERQTDVHKEISLVPLEKRGEIDKVKSRPKCCSN